jgi:hypothetical protein
MPPPIPVSMPRSAGITGRGGGREEVQSHRVESERWTTQQIDNGIAEKGD